ncbi:MAG: GntR family transcriptional regulator, partial [Clostridia bacterium]|nr:GntR family transcriptional regulator [Clostridia bacterium]
MRYGPITAIDKTGRQILLRNAEPDDADALLRYLKTTAAETPFLVREPEEITLSVEAERQFLESKIAAELKVSRTPVRDAFRQLKKEGLVEYIP